MRKLKLQMQMTVDGYIAGPKGEMDFMVWNWDNELKKYVKEITDPVDCIVLGRKLAEGLFLTGLLWLQILATLNLQPVRSLPTQPKSFLPKRLITQHGTMLF